MSVTVSVPERILNRCPHGNCLLGRFKTKRMRSRAQVTMLDALRKRCEFVDAAAERAGLANVRTLWMRAEDAGRDPTLREVQPL